jgi:3D (Asp-Asp-Asp) domain-containing protein
MICSLMCIALAGQIVVADVYAYTSTVSQTDDTPLITASGSHVIEGIIANNCLPFGSIVMIDSRIYTVEDRMNKRYGCDVYDIWFRDYDEAIDWGKRSKTIVVFPK